MYKITFSYNGEGRGGCKVMVGQDQFLNSVIGQGETQGIHVIQQHAAIFVQTHLSFSVYVCLCDFTS